MHIMFLHNGEPDRRSVLRQAVLCIVTLLLSCGCALEVARARGNALLLNTLEIPGWQLLNKPYRYSSENLYEYINGEAEFFVAYGFVSLVGANYSPGPESNDSITVDIYDMGAKLNAFGVFQSKRGGESSSLNIGAGSFGADGYVVFYKDSFYVEILSFVEDKQRKPEPIMIARKVAERIQGDISPPDELSYLPEFGRIEGTERYLKGGILGHAFLDRGIICDYSIEDNVVSAFVAFFPSSEDAGSSFKKHKEFLQRSGRRCLPLNGFGKYGFVSQEPYHKGILVVQEGPLIVGVYDMLKAQEGIELLKDIMKRIKSAH